MEDSKKIDVTPEAHAAAHEYVRERPGLSVKQWVSQLIQKAAGIVEVRPVEHPPSTAPSLDDPWTKPPFWAGRK